MGCGLPVVNYAGYCYCAATYSVLSFLEVFLYGELFMLTNHRHVNREEYIICALCASLFLTCIYLCHALSFIYLLCGLQMCGSLSTIKIAIANSLKLRAATSNSLLSQPSAIIALYVFGVMQCVHCVCPVTILYLSRSRCNANVREYVYGDCHLGDVGRPVCANGNRNSRAGKCISGKLLIWA